MNEQGGKLADVYDARIHRYVDVAVSLLDHVIVQRRRRRVNY